MYQATTYEFQGKTCLSGSINDVIRFGIPFLYKDEVTIPEVLKGVSNSYKDGKNLAALITTITDSDTYQLWKSNYIFLNETQSYITKGKILLNEMERNVNALLK
jgi:hypothetical protein